MPKNRQYCLFASFCRSFIIFEFLPLIEPASLWIPCDLLCCDDIVEGPMQLTHWLLPCVAQQLASDYIWAMHMHQIIAQTVARFFLHIVAQWEHGCVICKQGSVAAIWCKFLPYILWLYLTFSGNFYFAPFLPTALQLVRKTELQAEGRNLRVFEARVWGEQNYVGTNL